MPSINLITELPDLREGAFLPSQPLSFGFQAFVAHVFYVSNRPPADGNAVVQFLFAPEPPSFAGAYAPISNSVTPSIVHRAAILPMDRFKSKA